MKLSKYRKMFLTEATELLQSLNKALLALEKNPKKRELGHELMRAAHTLKSMSATMEFGQMAELCHKLEDSFELVRTGKIYKTGLPKKIISLLFRCFDHLDASLNAIREEKEELDCGALLKKLENVMKKELEKAEEGAEGTEEEDEASEVKELSEATQKIDAIKVDTEVLDALMNLTEELLTTTASIVRIERVKDYERLSGVVDILTRLSSDLQYSVTQARLIPLEYVFNRFPRMMRDLATKEEKEVEFILEGSEIELDRTVIDSLAEPLVHLLRNAVDHGIEKTQDEPGEIVLRAKREKEAVIIEVEDNGTGLNIEKIRSSAIERNILSEQQARALSEAEVINLLFHPRLSTNEKVTETSGRGVGLNVVKTKIEGLGGTVEVQSHPGEGTLFRLSIPLTIAIVQALLVRVGKQTYAIPITNVERSVHVDVAHMKSIGGMDVALVGKMDVPLLYLSDIFGIKQPRPKAEGKNTLVVMIKKEKEVEGGFVVDELLAEQEIVIKPLTKLLRPRREFTGVTILGDGKPALILDPLALLTPKHSARQKVAR